MNSDLSKYYISKDPWIDNIRDSIILFDHEGRIMDYNECAQKLLEKKDLKGECLVDYMQIPVEELKKRQQKLFQGENIENFECTLLIKGKEKQVLIDSTAIFDNDEFIGSKDIIRNLTHDKVTQNLLKEFQEKFKSFLSYLPGAIYHSGCTVDRKILYISNYIETIIGYTSEDFIHGLIKLGDIIHEEDKLRVFKDMEEAIEKKEIFNLQYRLIKKDKSIVWIRERGQGVYSNDGNLKYITGAIFDATEYVKTQDELIRGKQLFKLIFNNANIGIVLVDKNRDIQKVNKSFIELIGYSEEELLKKNVDDLTYTYGENERVFKDGKTTTEKQYRKKDGTIFWGRVNIVKVSDNETDICYMAFVEDIDEKKRSEVELNQKLKLEELATELSYDLNNELITDVEIVIKQSMQKIGNLLSLDRISLFFTLDKDPIRNRLSWARDKSYLVKDDEAIERISRMESLKNILYDKKSIIINDVEEYEDLKGRSELIGMKAKSYALVPFFKNNEFLGVMVFSTIKEKYEWTQNCVNFLKIVSDKIMLTLSRNHFERQRNELLYKLENKNQELKDFAKVVSHDLKAPLRGISSLVSWIKEDNYENLGEEGKNNINLVLERVEKMEGLIQGILDFSSLGIEKENSQEANIDKIIDDIIHFIDIPTNVKIVKDTPLPVINADEYRMKQVFMNLISNAIKYLDKEKGFIQIGASEKEEYWEFYVKDNGKGIKEKYFNKVFKIFETLNDQNSANGVGLSIVKKIVEMYNGKVSIESKIGEGTIFNFSIMKVNHQS